MIHFTLVVIIVNAPAQVAAPPVVQEQRLEKQSPEPGAINWHCPQCNWFNAYDNQKAFKIGSFQHLKRCKGSRKVFGA